MILFAVFLILVMMLVGFILTCKYRAKKAPKYDGLNDQDMENEMARMRYKGLDESESDDEETYTY